MAKGRELTPVTQIPLFSREVPDSFKKAVEILHNRPKGPLTLLQRKLLNALIKHAVSTSADEQDWWEISLVGLESDVGFDSNNREHLKDSARTLMKMVFEWDVMSGRKNIWKASVLFPEMELQPDRLRFQVSAHLRALMLRPEMYALIDMSVVRRFRRAASLATWEYCVRYQKLGRTPDLAWTAFRDMVLGEATDQTSYQEYKFFKSKVLKPCIAEINSESQIEIALVETKLGRRVDKIRFDIKRVVEEAEVIEDTVDLELLGELIKLGVMQSEAKRMFRTNSKEQIQAALAYTHRRQGDKRASKLDQPAAYFRRALSEGYASTAEDSKAASKPDPSKKKLDLRGQYALSQAVQAKGYFNELDAPDQELLIQRYNDQQQTQALRVTKKANRATEAAFMAWLALDLWGEPSPEQLVEFAQTLLQRA